MKLTTKMNSMLALTILGFAGAANAVSVPVDNAGFEIPAGPDGVLDNVVDGTNGWTKTGGGQIYNPGLNANAPEGSNSYLILEGISGYDLGTGSIIQALDDVLQEGDYTLTVQVGENATANSSFGAGYLVQLGYMDGATFMPLAEDNSTLAPSNGFETATVLHTAAAGDAGIGSNLAIRLEGIVTPGSNNQVLFDDVGLDFVAAPGDVDVYLRAQRFEKAMASGGSVPMWGFAVCDETFTSCADPADTDAPGPQIDAFAGFQVNIHVQNTLDIPVSIAIPGQSEEVGRVPVMMATDEVWAGQPARVQSQTHETLPGATATYTWNNLSSGTYLYQSGTLPSIQVPMGLYGALIVSEGEGVAYGRAFDAEAVLLVSEIDPIQNARVDAAGTVLPDRTCVPLSDYEQNMTAGYPCTVDYNPTYFLINGGASADLPAGDPTDDVLLRFLNAGLRSHTPSIVGVELGLIAEDGNAYPGLQRNQSAALLAAGKTLDAIVAMPNTDITYTLFDRMPTFSNENLPNGGSLATLQVGSGTPVVPPPASPANDDGPYAVDEDTALAVAAGQGLLANDDPGLSGPVVVSAPANGSVTLNGDGSFVYTPNPDFSGKDSFTYSVTDGLNTFGARATLNVSFVNDAPVAAGDAYSNNVGSSISVDAPGVLGNDADVDGDDLIAVLVSGTASLNPDGSFTASASGPFTYIACDQPLDTLGNCPAGSASNEVSVELTVNTASGIVLNVQEPGTPPVAVTAYRYTVEEDTTWKPDPSDPLAESLATNFHSSYMPVVAQGCVGAGACSEGETETPFGELALDPLKHYYVSVLPADAVVEDETGYRLGHTIGGAQIPPAAERVNNTVTVLVNKEPIPYAQISIFTFKDHSPTNGAVDGGEVGLGGVQITLEDAGGRYGISAGMMSQDADGNLLTNSLDCFGPGGSQPGVIISCPDTQENRDAGLVGQVLIKNLFPGKYGVIGVPPSGGAVTWAQTSTIEGTKVIDAWVKAGEPPFFAEFGPVGVHAFIGFASPEELAAANPGGPNTVSGAVTNFHMSRPPDQTLWDSGSYAALAHTRPWVGLNSDAGIGDNIAAVQATVNDDGTATFEIPNVPDGEFQLVVWDSFLDQVIAYRTVTQAELDAGGAIGNVPVFNWFARLENHVFLDEDGDGIRDTDEAPIAEQAVNLRWRDGSVYQSFPTDLEGFVPFDQVFPFFNWLVAEVDYTRFDATGLTVTVDGGGNVDPAQGYTGPYAGILSPQIQTEDCTTPDCLSRTETGQVLTQGFQGFLGQTSIFEWGKRPYAVGQNGGISGVVSYGVTRAESDPRLAAVEPWEPGIPRVKVRLYREVARSETSIAVTNPGFEIPGGGNGVLDNVVDGTNGWIKTGGGQIYNPGLDANAPEGFNSYLILNSIAGYDLGDGSVQQTLGDVLSEGSYTLNVEVGENATANSSFGSYRVQLGVTDGSNFILLAEDDNSLAPVNQFLTSTVEYTARAGDPNLDMPLVIRLVGNVAGTGNIQVLFDDVRLGYSDNGLALVQETLTDSWDDSLPAGCPGGHPTDPVTPADKCYDGLRNFNQARPAVFDGGYAFNDIPAGKYVVEVVPPPGYEILKEEDVNVGFGDGYASVFVTMPGGAVIPALPDAAMVAAAIEPDPGLAQPPCVGDMRQVPLTMSLFPAANAEAPFALSTRPLCNRKEVILSDQGQAAADFTLLTDAPIAGHFAGMVLDDVAQEFDQASPQFGEKWAPPFVPVSIRDFKGQEVTRVYTDRYGRMNGLLPSTFTANMPSPSGFSPAMHMSCMNDPGPIPGPDGELIIDPQYNPAYSNFCYTFQYMPGTTTYLDTPVLPVSAFASGDNPVDCAPGDGMPVISRVRWNNNFNGPWYRTRSATATTTTRVVDIRSARNERVPNPAYEGPTATGPAGRKTIVRDHGFGGTQGTVTVGGVPLNILSWNNGRIRAEIEAQLTAPLAGQLVVTRGDNGNSTEAGITITVSDTAPIRVPVDYPTIQDAIDAATAGDLILVAPGVYNESVIMWKPVRLQGAGAGSTIINGVNVPTDKLVAWREKMDSLFAAGLVDSLPGQPEGAAGFNKSEGAAVTVIGIFDPGTGAPPENSFLRSGAEARIDGFGITGATVGGGILVNSNADGIEISNNRVFGNSGSFGGGIRVGEPFLPTTADGPYAYNTNVNIHDNVVVQNAGRDGAGGGISLNAGSDNYNVDGNLVCGNFTLGDGGGIGHLGFSDNGDITNNRVLFNQTFNQAVTVSGGGVFVAGEPNAGGVLTQGSGNVDIDFNLIQGNHAGAGHGGGIRTQYVNGQDVVNALANNGNPRVGRWHRIRIRDNTIVNNVAGWSGGGVSLQDTARPALFRRNSIAHNDSTATVGGLIVNNLSANQPAGISTENHSALLAGVIVVHNTTNGLREFSNPDLNASNTLWENRSFHYNANPDGNPATADAGLVPLLSQSSPGECVAGATFWDLDDQLGGGLNAATGDGSGFVNPYCNGGRTLLTTPGPMLGLPALDEGGAAWVDVRFGPLTTAWPADAPVWSY